ncbi:DUF4377 domain-containing protein [Luteibacter sp. UNCMF366Tsu5.1]|uniref:DUF4377 domain-containing protein n=1 Tax=Luteibacter sp. UNCMF366Tsu5.1 TaxID=1502758 RepID=UPI000908DAC7|nr:DUF4377 domain-containing protein [Luteibacter sp. UNCMF366Tsu5.1]SFW74903.1 protein of unknown function [Luteibacter sp. UNCMF366Tsu5.1]
MRPFAFAVIAALLTGCATSPSDHGSRSRLLYIAGAKAPCTNGAIKAECLQYREQPNEPWQTTAVPLEDFDWKPGNEYLLKITEVHPKGVPDATAVRWHVDKVVEQHPVP